MFVVNGTLTEAGDVGVWTVRVQLVYYSDSQYQYIASEDNEART